MATGHSSRTPGGTLGPWLGSAAGLRLALTAALALAGLAGFVLYESLALGLHPAREAPPLFDSYHLGRSAFAAVAAALLVGAAMSARVPGCRLERTGLPGSARAMAIGAMALAIASVGLLAASPAGFHALAREDSPLEWLSALLLLAASATFALAALRHGQGGKVARLLAALLAVLLFVMGMEEISWLQRVIGFATPERLAEVNWQGEFNLHNVQTDLSEALYYSGAGLFLIALPLLRDAAPPPVAGHWLAGFVPGRGVAAASAPLALLNYGHWNLLPVQLTSWLAAGVLLAFAAAAARRGDRSERGLFLALALAVAVGQALVLAFGPAMADLPDATEYKELFIALGLAAFAWEAARTRASGATV